MAKPDLKETFGVRLRQARTMAGLSLRELSQHIERSVSHAALAKYENGEMMPDSAMLIRLSRALNQRPDFFIRPQTVELGNVRFRKMARLSANIEKAVQEQAVDHFERYGEIEAILGLAKPFVNPIGRSVVTTPGEAEEQAQALREAWSLGNDPIPAVIPLLESKGIMIYEANTEDRLLDGFSASTQLGPVIVIASWLKSNPLRKRMTTVHELAHLLFKLPGGIEEKVEEKLVSRFAGAFFLPADSFRDQLGRHRSVITLEELIQLKIFYGVSITSIMVRAQHLNLIDQSTFKKFWIECALKWKKAHGEPGDDRFQLKETAVRFRMLVHRGAAEGIITLTKGAELLNMPLGKFREELLQGCE